MFIKFPIFLFFSFPLIPFDEKFSRRNINCLFIYFFFLFLSLVYDLQNTFAPKVEKSFACRILTFDGTKKKGKKKKQS